MVKDEWRKRVKKTRELVNLTIGGKTENIEVEVHTLSIKDFETHVLPKLRAGKNGISS